MDEIRFLRTVPSKENRDDLWTLVCDADREFVPPLSARTGTTQAELRTSDQGNSLPKEYYENMLNQQFILACLSDKVIGFMTFIPDYSLLVGEKVMECVYISTIIVSLDFRNRGITRSLYRMILEEYPEKYIATRTWSTNYSHIHVLDKMGFEVIALLKGDRGEGIDTVYYCKNPRD